MRKTANKISILATFNKHSNAWLAGSEITRETDIVPGSLYPALHNMKQNGYLLFNQEKGDPQKLKRPLKTFYKLSETGKRLAKDWLEPLGIECEF